MTKPKSTSDKSRRKPPASSTPERGRPGREGASGSGSGARAGWISGALAAANQKGPYPRWLTAGMKAAVAVAVLTGLAMMADERRDRRQLARLAAEASAPIPTKASAAGTPRR